MNRIVFPNFAARLERMVPLGRVLDHVEGVYDADPERIRRSVHPDLKEFGFARQKVTDDYRIIPMTFDQLVEWDRLFPPGQVRRPLEDRPGLVAERASEHARPLTLQLL